jgi:DNA-binding MltR family transcriptional regulator
MLTNESDRGCVLATHAYCGQELAQAIRDYLINLCDAPKTLVEDLLEEGEFKPLGGFSSRAKMARALGLITQPTLEALVALNRLRNHFAHHPGLVRLTADRVLAIRDKLSPIEQLVAKGRALDHYIVMSWWQKKQRPSSARRMFMAVACLLSTNIPTAPTFEFIPQPDGSLAIERSTSGSVPPKHKPQS